MKASQFFMSTLKEAPAEAEVVSHQLMMRAGLIKRLGAGIYTYMPMGLRVLKKVEAIIRQEMGDAGAIELLMPLVQPAELWQESGRLHKMGPELLRVHDRHEREFVIQPTSEEVVTDIARQEPRSYRQLPKNFYHIQTKFRDERRPRFGVMRGREFIMKDAYSFDRDAASAARSYDTMFSAYHRIFQRLGLRYRAVAADTGAIGGDRSHEFQVIAQTGEDAIVFCPNSDYAANIELAQALPVLTQRAAPTQAMAQVATPALTSCEDVAQYVGVPLTQMVKSLALATDEVDDATGQVTRTHVWLLLVRADHVLNEVKVGKLAGLSGGFRFASNAEVQTHVGGPVGFLGPVGVPASVKVVADTTVACMSDFVCGANALDLHLRGVHWGRDLPEPALVADIRNVVPGDPSPDGQGPLAIERGIEVGHVFYLGTNYSQPLNATFLEEDGRPKLFEMGCYGIGVSRILGAAIEQNHDERGIIWSASMAPFSLVICPIAYDRSEAVRALADAWYAALRADGVDVMLDDRGERVGAMLADWELVGVPHRVVISERGLKAGQVEYQGRRDAQATTLAQEEALAFIKNKLGA